MDEKWGYCKRCGFSTPHRMPSNRCVLCSRKAAKNESQISGNKRAQAKRKGLYGNVRIYEAPKDGNAWDYHHIDFNRVIPVLSLVHSAIHHTKPLFSLEGIWG